MIVWLSDCRCCEFIDSRLALWMQWVQRYLRLTMKRWQGLQLSFSKLLTFLVCIGHLSLLLQEPSVVRDRDGNPQEDPLAVHCFCVCSRSALLGDLLGVSRSRERDLLSLLSIYPRVFLRVFIVYHLLVGFLFV